MKRMLQVCIGDAEIVVGTLWFTAEAGREHSTFQYAQSWIEHPKSFAIAPSMALDDTRKFFHGEQPLPPPIADTTPDSWGRGIIIKDAQQKKQDAFTEFDFLTASDDFSRIGALRFRNMETGSPFLASRAEGGCAIPPLLHLHQIGMDVSRMEDGDPTALALTRLREAGGSLGGARPKCSIIDTDGHLCIAKFTSKRDTHAVERAEVLTSRLAHLCGITVPRSRIEMSGDSPVAIIERFDRTVNHKRIPFISAQTMLSASKATGGTYADLADAIRLHSVSPATDLTDLFRRVAFNILVSNTDDHLKNHGFLYDGKGKWRMAPAYDVNPSPHRQKTLKTAIADPQNPIASMELLMDYAFYFDLEKDVAAKVVSHMAKTIASQWKYLAREVGMTHMEINSYQNAFTHEESCFSMTLSGATFCGGTEIPENENTNTETPDAARHHHWDQAKFYLTLISESPLSESLQKLSAIDSAVKNYADIVIRNHADLSNNFSNFHKEMEALSKILVNPMDEDFIMIKEQIDALPNGFREKALESFALVMQNQHHLRP